MGCCLSILEKLFSAYFLAMVTWDLFVSTLDLKLQILSLNSESVLSSISAICRYSNKCKNNEHFLLPFTDWNTVIVNARKAMQPFQMVKQYAQKKHLSWDSRLRKTGFLSILSAFFSTIYLTTSNMKII